MYRFLGRFQALSLLRSSYIGIRAEPASHWMAAGAFFLGSRAVGHEYLMTKLRMCGAIPSLPSYDFMTCTGTARPFTCSCSKTLCRAWFTYTGIALDLSVSYVPVWMFPVIIVYEFMSVLRQRGNRVFYSTLMFYCTDLRRGFAAFACWHCGF